MASETSPQANGSPSGVASVFQTLSNSLSHSHFTNGPKLSIKLDDLSFLLWNQQVEGVVKIHKLQRFLVNPKIWPKYATDADRLADVISGVLPRVLSCYHSWQVWEKLQQHYFSHLKAKTRQICNELKNTKKGLKSVSEFLTKVHSLADSLAAVGETIADTYLTDVVLDGLPEEFNPFVMMIYGKQNLLR